MSNEELETDALNQTEEVEETVDNTEDTQEEKTEEVDYEAEAKKAKELADNYKRRAEKAEQKAKEAKKQSPDVTLSQSDIVAIVRADIHDDDMERVTRFAQMEGVSVKEALNNDDLKAILDRRSEARKVAQATNTGSSKPLQSDSSGDALKAKAKKNFGSLTANEIERLASL